MFALVAGNRVFGAGIRQVVDGREKPGYDESYESRDET